MTHPVALVELEKTTLNLDLAPQSSDIELWEPRITLITSPRDRLPIDALHSSAALDTSTASWVLINIRDNGPGIPQVIQEQVFQDFFTTKPSGDGTGLGLPITRQIVTEKHGGYLILRSPIPEVAGSQPTSGTEFEILLPMRVSPTINPRAQFSALATRPALFS